MPVTETPPAVVAFALQTPGQDDGSPPWPVQKEAQGPTPSLSPSLTTTCGMPSPAPGAGAWRKALTAARAVPAHGCVQRLRCKQKHGTAVLETPGGSMHALKRSFTGQAGCTAVFLLASTSPTQAPVPPQGWESLLLQLPATCCLLTGWGQPCTRGWAALRQAPAPLTAPRQRQSWVKAPPSRTYGGRYPGTQ